MSGRGASVGLTRLFTEETDLRRDAVDEAGEDELVPIRSLGVRTSMGIVYLACLLAL